MLTKKVKLSPGAHNKKFLTFIPLFLKLCQYIGTKLFVGRKTVATKNSKINKILEKLESNELLSALAFGAAIIFMGFTFLPIKYDAIGKLGISLIFLSLGAFVIIFSLRKISENPWFAFIRHALYLMLGVCFGAGSVFLVLFVISKLSFLFFSALLFIL